MKKALVVGIDEYPGSARLRSCVNDAEKIAELLDKHADGSPNFDVLISKNVKDKSTLKSLINDLFKGDEDACLFYFSGHGSISDTGGYIVTPDFKRHDEGIVMDEILAMASRSKARNKIVILDCCHAGAMGTSSSTGNSTAFLQEGVVILAASRSTEAAIESAGQGVFTSLLLEALRGGAADIGGEVTAGNIYSYIDKALGSWSQRPVFKANIVRSVSLRTVKPVVPLQDLRKLKEYFPEVTTEYKLDPSYEYTSPNPDEQNVITLKILRKMQFVGLVEPVNEEYIYWAAMNYGSCRLTPLGAYFWKLLQRGRI